MTLFLLAAVLSTADVGAARTACAVSHARASASPIAFTRRITAPPHEKSAVRTEAPLATLVAYCASPQRRASAAYSKPALTRRAASAASRSERAPPLSPLT